MREGAQKFVGEHDFRNFCKMDAANVHNFRRHITSFDVFYTDQRLDSTIFSIEISQVISVMWLQSLLDKEENILS